MSAKHDNSGTLARNEDKKKPGANPAWPDFKGSATVDGVEYWLSGWAKEGPRGKFVSIALKPKDEAKRSAPAPAADDGDDIF
ncbi:MAG TPA: hypothetical protein PKE55_00810 [Kiritimatiellia bacterium]|nr:hypothetical protein [Kiritimatiellia bacterium]